MPAETCRAVFLSYASQDAVAAGRICDALRAAGIEVWFDQSELRGGDKWDQNIRRQIRECVLFAPIISANTQVRGEGYFRLEWKLAADRSHLMARDQLFFLPIVVDDTPYASARVPDEFHAVQWTRLPGGDTADAFCERVRSLLASDSASQSAHGTRTPVQESRPPLRGTVPPVPPAHGPGRTALRWALAAVAVVAAGLVLWRQRDGVSPPGGPDPQPAGMAKSAKSAVSPPVAAEVRLLVNKARELFQEGDDARRSNFFEAEEHLKRAVALDPSDADAWAAWGQLSTDLYRYAYDRTPARLKAMREQIATALLRAPAAVESQLAQAAAADYFRLDPAATEATLRELALRAPDNFRVWHALGRQIGRAGRVDEAAAAFARADEVGRTHPSPMADAATYFLAAGRYAEAEAATAKSLSRRLNGRALIWDLILQLCWHGNAPAAAAALEKWPAWLFTEDRGATIAGLVWLWNNEPDKALAIYERIPREFVRDLNFTGPRAALTAMAHAQAGRQEKARDDWAFALRAAERELALDPDSFYALHWKARALAEQGDRVAAETVLRQFERAGLEPASYYAPEAKLTGLALALGDRAAALGALQRSFTAPGISRPLFKNAFVNFPLTRAVLQLNPVFAPLRQDDQFKAIVARAPAPVAPVPGSG